MIEGQRELHHRSHGERSVDSPGAFDDPSRREDRGLPRVEDRRTSVDPEDTDIGDRDGASVESAGVR